MPSDLEQACKKLLQHWFRSGEVTRPLPLSVLVEFVEEQIAKAQSKEMCDACDGSGEQINVESRSARLEMEPCMACGGSGEKRKS
jgi:DnaJ-class molecular chaperone